MSDDVDRTIEAYCERLQAEAALARNDLDEIEDHLRCLVDELRAQGIPAAEAVVEACARMGDPRHVAREHARVRTHFGARLSRLRAWSAAAVLLPRVLQYGLVGSQFGSVRADAVAGLVLLVALVARRTWAHAIWLGYCASGFVVTAAFSVSWPEPNLVDAVWYGGALAFLVPWRRSELTGAAVALAAHAWTYSIAVLALHYRYNEGDGWQPVAPAAHVAILAALIAAAGSIVRARWGSLASAVAGVAMTVALVQLWSLSFQFAHPDVFRAGLLGAVGLGALGSSVGALLAWRAASSNLGTRPV